MTVYDLLVALKATPSLKTKEALLREHKDNELLKTYLVMALSPTVVYNVSKAPQQQTHGATDQDAIVVRNLIHIAQNQLRGAVLTEYLRGVSDRYTPEAYYVFSRALEKDLDCNVGSTIVNKVWPKLIPEHPYMGAKSDTTENRKKLGIEKGAMAQEKCDGMYCDIVVDGHSPIRAFTRQGQLLNLAGTAVLNDCRHLTPGVYQGELRVLNFDTSAFEPRHIGNAIVKGGLKGGNITLGDNQTLVFTVWDMVDEKSWQEGACEAVYGTRFNSLCQALNNIHITAISLVRSRQVSAWDSANQFYIEILSSGGEGAIVKRLDGKWKDGKPSWQVKMKVEESCDMRVTGVVPHKKVPGYVGSLEVESGGLYPLRASCGGLMEEAMSHGADFWVGKVIRMKFNALSPYGRFDHPRVDNGKPPVWDACIRAEGSKPNTAATITSNYKRATCAQ